MPGARSLRSCRQRGLQPAEPVAVELTTLLTIPFRVEDDEPQRAKVDRILHGITAVTGNAEMAAQCKTVVMVTGQDVERRP